MFGIFIFVIEGFWKFFYGFAQRVNSFQLTTQNQECITHTIHSERTNYNLVLCEGNFAILFDKIFRGINFFLMINLKQ